MRSRILILDPSPDARELLRALLESRGHQVLESSDIAAISAAFESPPPDLVLLELVLPDGDGMELISKFKKQWPETAVIAVTSLSSIDSAVAAIKRGAHDFITKPFEAESLLARVQDALMLKQEQILKGQIGHISEEAPELPVSQSFQMRDVVHTVERIAPTDVTVLITGESGTGKEVIARLIHALSTRNRARMININCAALPRELIESELFGSVKGAFTGAQSDREGLFRQAEGGTLFLDEISEMPVDTQSKLLRVLQDREVRPVGGKTTYKIDCRVITATNRHPEDAIRTGKLREDLYYRISALSVHIPPLRERRDDIPPLANLFLQRFAAQAGRTIAGFTPAALERLTAFDWPGNVRQLQNEVQRAVLLSETPLIDVADLSLTHLKNTGNSASDSWTLLEGVERNTILQTLRETGGNRLETAKRLGIGRQTLYNKMRAYGIEAGWK